MQILINRFKKKAFIVTINLFKKRYFMKNVRRHQESREYVQKIIRCVKSIEMISVFNQLNIIYNKINENCDEIFENHSIQSI